VEISTAEIKELRDQTGAGIMDCRRALIDSGGDPKKAQQLLKEKNILVAKKTAGRTVRQGLIEAYIHPGGRLGAMIELNCETDFVARTKEFQELAHQIAMQVAALGPQFISQEEVPATTADVDPKVACLLLQSYIKNPELTVQDIINEVVGKVGENIKVSRFARFELGG